MMTSFVSFFLKKKNPLSTDKIKKSHPAASIYSTEQEFYLPQLYTTRSPDATPQAPW